MNSVKNLSANRILIIGPIAPPIGGVSIHISRLADLIKKDFELDFIDESREIKKNYFNLRSLHFLRYFTKIKNSNLLYIHSGKNILRIFHLLAGKIFGKKIILTIHSFKTGTSKIICLFNGKIYKLANTIIVVNSEIKERLSLPEKKTIVKEAFIPPNIQEEPELPKNIQEIISQNKKKENKIICANASRLEFHNNQDLYGLDQCLEVAERLFKKKIKFYFIFVVSSIEKNSDKFYKYKSQINERHLQSNFLLTNEKLSFVKLMEQADIVVRPTNTDGDSITIREAVFFKKPVLASNIVKRPEGVHLFRTRDIDDFEKKITKLITLNFERDPSEKFTSALHLQLSKLYSEIIVKTLYAK